jgi:ParB family chromosome partitioning protein
MEKYEIKPSHSQAVRLKKLSQDKQLTVERIDGILAEEKAAQKDGPTASMRFRKYFPPDYSQKQMEKVIIGLLKQWKAGVAV